MESQARHVALRETYSDLPLRHEQVEWLRSLVRMQIRRRQRALDGFHRRPEQSPREAQEVLEKFERNLQFARETLTALDAIRGDISRLRESTSWHGRRTWPGCSRNSANSGTASSADR